MVISRYRTFDLIKCSVCRATKENVYSMVCFKCSKKKYKDLHGCSLSRASYMKDR